MANLQYSKILRKNWEIVALIMGVAVVLALIVSLLQPFQYSATTKMLIIQKQEKNLDAYTATKSAERIANNLASIIFTSSFYNEVIDSNPDIAAKFLPDSTERRKAWKKNVQATVIPETGILQIQVFDVDRNYASQVVKTISYVLINKGGEYHGGGTEVSIKIVDDVFISKYPVRPNIILNGSLALLIGFLLGSAYIILSEAKRIKKDYESELVLQPSLFEEIKTDKEKTTADKTEFYDETDIFDLNDKSDSYGEPELVTEAISEEEAPAVERIDQIEIKTMYDHLQ
jgi:capsular polysaccharide biosynthesis protein